MAIIRQTFAASQDSQASQTNAVPEANPAPDEVPEQALQPLLEAFDATLQGLQLALSLHPAIVTRDVLDAERTMRRCVTELLN